MKDIKIDCHIDPFGGLKMKPVGLSVWSAFNAHMVLAGHPNNGEAATAYIQEASDETLAEYLSPKQIRHVKRGYTATILMDPWVFGYLLGDDACEVDITKPIWRRPADEQKAYVIASSYKVKGLTEQERKDAASAIRSILQSGVYTAWTAEAREHGERFMCNALNRAHHLPGAEPARAAIMQKMGVIHGTSLSTVFRKWLGPKLPMTIKADAKARALALAWFNNLIEELES